MQIFGTQAWQECARRVMAKRNSGQKLGRCLGWLASSLDRALEQLTMRLEVGATRLCPGALAQCIHFHAWSLHYL